MQSDHADMLPDSTSATSKQPATTPDEPPVVDVTAKWEPPQDFATGLVESKWQKHVCWVACLSICLLLDLFVPSVFWIWYDWFPRNSRLAYLRDWGETFAFLASGGLAAQLGIVSLWCAVGVGNAKWRVLYCSLAALFISSTFVIGLQIAETPSSLDVWVAAFLVGIGIVGFFFGAGICKLICWRTGKRICFEQRLSQPDDAVATSSVSISYIIGLTTLVAIAIATLRAVLPQDEGAPPSLSEFISASLVVLQHAGVCVALLLFSTHLVLGSYVGLSRISLILFMAVITIGVHLRLMNFYEFTFDMESALWSLAFLAGFVLITSFFLGCLRLFGYRFVASKQHGLAKA